LRPLVEVQVVAVGAQAGLVQDLQFIGQVDVDGLVDATRAL